MKQAASFQKFRVPLLAARYPDQYQPDRLLSDPGVQLQRFKGETWELFGESLHAESSLSPTARRTASTTRRPPDSGGLSHLRFPPSL
jgi:hypothetical protein